MSIALITSSQIRAARHLANLSQADIARATGLSLPTIRRAESQRDVSVSADAIAAIRTALEAAGVEFIAENGGGAGMRLKKPRARSKRRSAP
jgi:transcriptional regulator with XRE-family HTH domain